MIDVTASMCCDGRVLQVSHYHWTPIHLLARKVMRAAAVNSEDNIQDDTNQFMLAIRVAESDGEWRIERSQNTTDK